MSEGMFSHCCSFFYRRDNSSRELREVQVACVDILNENAACSSRESPGNDYSELNYENLSSRYFLFVPRRKANGSIKMDPTIRLSFLPYVLETILCTA